MDGAKVSPRRLSSCCDVAEQASRRVFFALWPDQAALDKLDAIARSGANNCGGRRMRRETLHVTLLFLGAVPQGRLPDLIEVAGTVVAEPFEMVLDRVGWWSRNRILWLGCTSVPSRHRRLHDSLAGALASAGFPVECRAYHPHLTLVRQARCQNLPSVDLPVCWQAKEFSLIESRLRATGADYRTLFHWSLEGKSGSRDRLAIA